MTANISSATTLGYARVSTATQVVDRQIDALIEAGVTADNIFTDRISGTTAARPQLDRLMNHLRAGDTLVVHALDRLGRDTRQLLAWCDELRERQVSLRILQLGVDTGTPAGRMVLTVIAALAAMEREVLVERTREGIEAARLRGRIGGRPAALTETQRTAALKMHTQGQTTGTIAELLRCSPRTIRRVIAAAR